MGSKDEGLCNEGIKVVAMSDSVAIAGQVFLEAPQKHIGIAVKSLLNINTIGVEILRSSMTESMY